ncbi:hypothetical protein D3C75_999830 [compost metagenome]
MLISNLLTVIPFDAAIATYPTVIQALRAAINSSCGFGAVSVPNISVGSSAAIWKLRSYVFPQSS